MSADSDDVDSRCGSQRSISFFSNKSKPQVPSRSPTPFRQRISSLSNGNGIWMPVAAAAFPSTSNDQSRKPTRKWALPEGLERWSSNNEKRPPNEGTKKQQLNVVQSRSASSKSSLCAYAKVFTPQPPPSMKPSASLCIENSVNILGVKDPACFYVQAADRDNCFSNMEKMCFQEALLARSLKTVKLNCVYLAQTGRVWHRVWTLAASSDEFQVRLIDRGTECLVTRVRFVLYAPISGSNSKFWICSISACGKYPTAWKRNLLWWLSARSLGWFQSVRRGARMLLVSSEKWHLRKWQLWHRKF